MTEAIHESATESQSNPAADVVKDYAQQAWEQRRIRQALSDLAAFERARLDLDEQTSQDMMPPRA